MLIPSLVRIPEYAPMLSSKYIIHTFAQFEKKKTTQKKRLTKVIIDQKFNKINVQRRITSFKSQNQIHARNQAI